MEYVPSCTAPAENWGQIPASRLASRNILNEQNIKKRTGPALCVFCGTLPLHNTVSCPAHVYTHWFVTWARTGSTLSFSAIMELVPYTLLLGVGGNLSRGPLLAEVLFHCLACLSLFYFSLCHLFILSSSSFLLRVHPPTGSNDVPCCRTRRSCQSRAWGSYKTTASWTSRFQPSSAPSHSSSRLISSKSLNWSSLNSKPF
jgi:hypothetical protein